MKQCWWRGQRLCPILCITHSNSNEVTTLQLLACPHLLEPACCPCSESLTQADTFRTLDHALCEGASSNEGTRAPIQSFGTHMLGMGALQTHSRDASQDTGLTGQEHNQERTRPWRGRFKEDNADLMRRDSWYYSVYRTLWWVWCSLLGIVWDKTYGKNFCKEQHAEEIQDTGELQGLIFIMLQVRASGNKPFTLIHGSPQLPAQQGQTTQYEAVQSDPQVKPFTAHPCCSSTRIWEDIYCIVIVLPLGLCHKEKKNGKGANTSVRYVGCAVASAQISAQYLSWFTPLLPGDGSLLSTHCWGKLPSCEQENLFPLWTVVVNTVLETKVSPEQKPD